MPEIERASGLALRACLAPPLVALPEPQRITPLGVLEDLSRILDTVHRGALSVIAFMPSALSAEVIVIKKRRANPSGSSTSSKRPSRASFARGKAETVPNAGGQMWADELTFEMASASGTIGEARLPARAAKLDVEGGPGA